MSVIDMHAEEFPQQSHDGHRLLDVTAIGHFYRRLLCLDCKVEFEEVTAGPDRTWMSGTF
jgi:hypothetical protein